MSWVITDTKGLKPCPFCGGDAKLRGVGLDNGEMYHFFMCGKCLASTHGGETIDEAKKRWNTRPYEKEETNE